MRTESEGIVGEDDELKGGDEERIEGKDPRGLGFVAAVADGEDARRGGAEIDDEEKEGGERVEPEMPAEPGQAERQDERCGRGREGGKREDRGEAGDEGGGGVENGALVLA